MGPLYMSANPKFECDIGGTGGTGGTGGLSGTGGTGGIGGTGIEGTVYMLGGYPLI